MKIIDLPAISDPNVLDANVMAMSYYDTVLGKRVTSKITLAQLKNDIVLESITGAATTIVSNNLSINRVVTSNGLGKIDVSAVTTTELGYVGGVTSAIQTQINTKQSTITGAATTITSLDLTASRALIANALGKIAISTTTDTELSYVSGVTSSIQTQLNAKSALGAYTDRAIARFDSDGSILSSRSFENSDDEGITIGGTSGLILQHNQQNTPNGGYGLMQIYPFSPTNGTYKITNNAGILQFGGDIGNANWGFYDASNITKLAVNSSGIPLTALHVSEISTSSVRGIMTSQYSTGTDGARIVHRKSRGSQATPLTIVTGDTLGSNVYEAYDGTSYVQMGMLKFASEGTIGTDRIPTNFSISTATDAATSVLTTALTIDSSQRVGIGVAPTTTLEIKKSYTAVASNFAGSANTYADVSLDRGASINVDDAGITTFYRIVIDAPTLTTTSSKVLTESAGMYIQSPILGSGVTATKAYSIRTNGTILALSGGTIPNIEMRTSNTDGGNKQANLTITARNNSSNPSVSMVGMVQTSTTNPLSIGGGNANFQASTSLSFFTTPAIDTLTGTLAMAIDSSQRVGIGIAASSITAVLHLKAGTASANTAPLKFNSGTNLTTAEAGAMEYNGTNLFFTRSGTTREGVLTQSAVTTESVASDRTVTVNIGGVTYKLLAKS